MSRFRASGFTVLMLTYVALLPVLFRPAVHGADTVGYFSWLRSAVVSQTLDVLEAFQHYSEEFGEETRLADIDRKTPTGFTHNQWAAGSALLWSPVYIVAHLGMQLLSAIGLGVASDGYSQPYVLAASFASTVYGLAAVLLTHSVARRLFPDFAATTAVLVVWLASPAVFYMYSHPLLSQANDAFVNALFVYVWWNTRSAPSPRGGLFRGMSVGLAAWVRTQNVALVLLLALDLSVDLFRAVGGSGSVRAVFHRIAASSAGFLLLFMPLALFWRVVFGSWLVNSYSATQGAEAFNWSAPHILEVIFSTDRGIVVWAPGLAFASLGLWWLIAKERRFGLMLAGMLLLQLYVVGSWFTWSGGFAFGPRFWVGQMAPFGLGLAALIWRLRSVPRSILGAAAACLIVWNFLLIVQYSLGVIPRNGPVDVGLMVRNQFSVVPQNVSRIGRALLTREQQEK